MPRPPAAVSRVPIGTLDVEHLAACGVVVADDRSTSTGGRFSVFDLRAGAIRALPRSGIQADRGDLDGVIEEITARGTALTHRLLDGDVPAHVKGFMASSAVLAKVRVGWRLEDLARPGRSLLPSEPEQIVPASVTLDESPIDGNGPGSLAIVE